MQAPRVGILERRRAQTKAPVPYTATNATAMRKLPVAHLHLQTGRPASPQQLHSFRPSLSCRVMSNAHLPTHCSAKLSPRLHEPAPVTRSSLVSALASPPLKTRGLALNLNLASCLSPRVAAHASSNICAAPPTPSARARPASTFRHRHGNAPQALPARTRGNPGQRENQCTPPPMPAKIQANFRSPRTLGVSASAAVANKRAAAVPRRGSRAGLSPQVGPLCSAG